MRRKLERVEIPDERAASERAWRMFRSAFAEMEPRPPARRRVGLLALAAAAVVALVVVAVSPAGPALVRSVRSAVGSEHAERTLVALPSAGRLLVDSGRGPWIVNADGSKRLLGRYDSSSWSPHGLFELVVRGHELAALDPKGNVRWSIERRGKIRDPRWSPDGYRVAYRAGESLRVIAGDGTGDRLLAPRTAAVAPDWQPGADHVLAYVTAHGDIRVVNADSGATVARRRDVNRPLGLRWSANGRLLLSIDGSSVDVRTASLQRVASLRPGEATTIIDAAWAPRGARYALLGYQPTRNRSVVVIQAVHGRGTHTVFVGTGRIDGVNWSPDGRWLLLAWRTADQWLFAHTQNPARIHAVSSISAQFHSHGFPRLAGWCC